MGLVRHAPRFGQIREVFPLLPASDKVVFFAPHTSEHPALMPLISEISETLAGRGRKAETHSVENMREAVSSISFRLRRLKLSKAEIPMLDSLLRMKDACIRLDILFRIMQDEPGAVVAEMHALRGDYGPGDRFGEGERFFRIPGTRILYLKDYLEEYAAAITKGREALSVRGSEGYARAAEIAGAGSSEAEARLRLARLGENIRRAILLKIPALPGGPGPAEGCVTRFEMDYGVLSGHHTLSGWEAGELASVFR
ncbi:MAG TPA: hypothetical protein VLD37_03425 [Candidatus Bilamarchaeum sp.]|nr:hypothetical protein [Candidatus Bilamarchaeum sp.]